MKKEKESTMFKSFTGFSELKTKTIGHAWYIKLAGCGWCAPVSKKGLKQVADSMKRSGAIFFGTITFMGGGRKSVQISLT